MLDHTVIASSSLKLIEAKHVEGPCADEIVRFNNGLAFLSSGERFMIRDDGAIELHPPVHMDRPDITVDRVESLPGYALVMANRLFAGSDPSAPGKPYLGVFKSKSDYVIARFDILGGKPSSEAEVLVRSRSPIVSVDYLHPFDTLEGWVGFAQRSGPKKAALYIYRWNHGLHRPLKF